jgi:hypothetical protein
MRDGTYFGLVLWVLGCGKLALACKPSKSGPKDAQAFCDNLRNEINETYDLSRICSSNLTRFDFCNDSHVRDWFFKSDNCTNSTRLKDWLKEKKIKMETTKSQLSSTSVTLDVRMTTFATLTSKETESTTTFTRACSKSTKIEETISTNRKIFAGISLTQASKNVDSTTTETVTSTPKTTTEETTTRSFTSKTTVTTVINQQENKNKFSCLIYD